MANITEKIEGRKFMRDNEEGKYLVYTRRVVTEIILEEGGQRL
jgi:hypothetical protein